eukprot:1156244-Pelagomonas_calceolata.AAC.13
MTGLSLSCTHTLHTHEKRYTCALPILAQSPKEPSEEVRLVLAQIVVVLIRLGGKAISAYAAEVVGFVVVMSEDPFHEVAMQACAAVVELNGRQKCGAEEQAV